MVGGCQPVSAQLRPPRGADRELQRKTTFSTHFVATLSLGICGDLQSPVRLPAKRPPPSRRDGSWGRVESASQSKPLRAARNRPLPADCCKTRGYPVSDDASCGNGVVEGRSLTGWKGPNSQRRLWQRTMPRLGCADPAEKARPARNDFESAGQTRHYVFHAWVRLFRSYLAAAQQRLCYRAGCSIAPWRLSERLLRTRRGRQCRPHYGRSTCTHACVPAMLKRFWPFRINA